MKTGFLPLKHQAYNFLKKMLIEGDISPGIIYSETKIAAECGISRTPMRDAIQILAQEGYIDIIPSKGFSVHKLNETDLTNLYQIRCALEGFCVVQLTKSIKTDFGKKIISSLKKYIQNQEEIIHSSQSIKDFTLQDTEFHNTIVHSLGNAHITSAFDSYHFQMREQTLISLKKEGRLEETLSEHKAIVAGIESGDSNISYNATLYHLEQPKGIIMLEM